MNRSAELRRIVLGGEASAKVHKRMRRHDRQTRAYMALRRQWWKLMVPMLATWLVSLLRRHHAR